VGAPGIAPGTVPRVKRAIQMFSKEFGRR